MLIELDERSVCESGQLQSFRQAASARKNFKGFHGVLLQVAEVGLNHGDNGCLRVVASFTPPGPPPAWVQNIPVRFCLPVAATSRIVIAETIENRVPKRATQLDQSCFNCADHVGTGFLENNKSAHEVLRKQALSQFNASGVFRQATEQLPRLIFGGVCGPGLAPTSWHSFPDVYWEAVIKPV